MKAVDKIKKIEKFIRDYIQYIYCMKKNNYKVVNLPKEMVDTIDRIVKKRKDLGFVSRDDFVRDAVRESIAKYNGRLIVEGYK